jgi:hypothetical protein
MAGTALFNRTRGGDMRNRIGARTLLAIAALSIAAPAVAGNVPIDYTILVSGNGMTVPIGTMVLDYDGSSYSLESLIVTLQKTAVVTSDVTLAPVPGTSDYCLYTFSSCGIVPEENSLYVIFDPSLTTQDSTLYGYSTDNADTESVSAIIERTALPEPATWALMLLGFGAIGASMRRRRRRAVRLAA